MEPKQVSIKVPRTVMEDVQISIQVRNRRVVRGEDEFCDLFWSCPCLAVNSASLHWFQQSCLLSANLNSS